MHIYFPVYILSKLWPSLSQIPQFCLIQSSLIYVRTCPPYPTRPVLKTSSPATEASCPKENPFILVPSSKTRCAVWAWQLKDSRQMSSKISPKNNEFPFHKANLARPKGKILTCGRLLSLGVMVMESSEPLGPSAETAGHCELCCECWGRQICSACMRACVVVCVL